MEQELISIIVPVYNAERYLPMAMEMLLRQTYKNIEIILVDDGSTDDSYLQCCKYAETSEKVHAFSKKNGGAASARNFGFKKSRGQYITFVDADDWISKDYVEFLYKLLTENKADISVCGYRKCFSYPKNADEKKGLVTIFSPEEAIENLLYRKSLTNSPCLKLLKRETFEKIKFPEGMLYEDLAVVYRWFGESRRIAYSSEVKYYYFQRQGSSMHSGFNIKKWDLIHISEQICKYIGKKYPALKSAANSRLFISSLQMIREVPLSKKYKEYRKQLKYNICELRKGILKDKKTSRNTKILALSAYLPYILLKFMGVTSSELVMKLKIVQKY